MNHEPFAVCLILAGSLAVAAPAGAAGAEHEHSDAISLLFARRFSFDPAEDDIADERRIIDCVRSSDPYREAVAAVRDNASSRRLLGAPVEPGWYVTGYVEGVNSHGRAKLRFPVSGPRSEGTVRLSASRNAGEWAFSMLELQVDGRSIDLLRP